MGADMMEIGYDLLSFFREEQAQASIEYFLMVGSVIVAAAMIFSSYYKMSYTGMDRLNVSSSEIATETCNYVANALDATFIIGNQTCGG
jgi:uncharacterized protein (UPF0333 family)